MRGEKKYISELKEYDWIPREIIRTKGVKDKIEKVNKLYIEWIDELVREKEKQGYTCTVHPLEWSAAIYAEKSDNKFMIRDFVIFPGQRNRYTSTGSDDSSIVNNEMDERNKKSGRNLYLVGDMHSHADFGAFHSSIDDECMNGLSDISDSTERVFREDFEYFEQEPKACLGKDSIVLGNDNEYDPVIEIKLPEGYDKKKADECCKLLNKAKLSFSNPVSVKFFQSVVVNVYGKCYGETIVRKENMITGEKNKTPYITSVKTVKASDDIKVDEEELKKEIREKIIPDIEYRKKIDYTQYPYNSYPYDCSGKYPDAPGSSGEKPSEKPAAEKQPKEKMRAGQRIANFFKTVWRDFLMIDDIDGDKDRQKADTGRHDSQYTYDGVSHDRCDRDVSCSEKNGRYSDDKDSYYDDFGYNRYNRDKYEDEGTDDGLEDFLKIGEVSEPEKNN